MRRPCPGQQRRQIGGFGRVIDPESQQRMPAILWHQRGQPGFQRITRLIGQIARNPMPGFPRRIQPCQRGPQFIRSPRQDQVARAAEQHGLRAGAMFQKDHASVSLP